MNKAALADKVRQARFAIGRWLIHAGLRTLPGGQFRKELTFLLAIHGNHVRHIAKTADDWQPRPPIFPSEWIDDKGGA